MRIALAQGVSPQLAYATSCAGWQAKGTYKPNAAQAQAVYEAELEWLDARAKAGLNGWTDPRKSRKLPSPRGSAETETEPGWMVVGPRGRIIPAGVPNQHPGTPSSYAAAAAGRASGGRTEQIRRAQHEETRRSMQTTQDAAVAARVERETLPYKTRANAAETELAAAKAKREALETKYRDLAKEVAALRESAKKSSNALAKATAEKDAALAKAAATKKRAVAYKAEAEAEAEKAAAAAKAAAAKATAAAAERLAKAESLATRLKKQRDSAIAALLLTGSDDDGRLIAATGLTTPKRQHADKSLGTTRKRTPAAQQPARRAGTERKALSETEMADLASLGAAERDKAIHSSRTCSRRARRSLYGAGACEDIAGGASPDASHPSFRRQPAAEGDDTWF